MKKNSSLSATEVKQLAELNAKIEILAKRANTRISRLKKYSSKDDDIYARSLFYMQKQAFIGLPSGSNLINAGSKTASRFSRSKAKSIKEAKLRLSALQNVDKAETVTKKGISNVVKKRRKALSKLLFNDEKRLSQKEYEELADLFDDMPDKNFDSDSVIDVFKAYADDNVFDNLETVKAFIEENRGKIVSKELEELRKLALQGGAITYDAKTKQFNVKYKIK